MRKDKYTIQAILYHLAACFLSVVGVVATGWFFDRYSLPVFHIWALAHGTVFILFPFYWWAFYKGLYALKRFFVTG